MTAAPGGGRADVRRILVGARGVLGRRLVRRVRERGMEAVAAFAEADAEAPYVEEADYDAFLGEGPADRVWEGARLVELAMDAGCDAIHPGRGPAGAALDLYAAASAANVLVIGLEPRRAAETLDVVRMAAKARAVGLRTPPLEVVGVDEDGIEAAARVGLPLRVVPAHGGATCRVDGFDALGPALDRVGRPAVLIHEVTGPARLEVVLVGDRDGVVSLGAAAWRTPSVVRYPAPEVADLVAPARLLAQEVGLVGVATVQLRVGADGSAWWWGLRPQLPAAAALVEAVQGVDLFAAQLDAALGQRLGWGGAAAPTGCGAGARVRRTGPGEIAALALPAGEGIGAVAAVDVGAPVPQDADDTLLELVAVAEDPGAAEARLRAALDAVAVSGVPTDLDAVRADAAAPPR